MTNDQRPMTNDHFVKLMPLSNSVLRRYTPPTCTLEIAAKSSPLSRWVGQSLMKDLRFELRFDDPRQPEEKRVTIRGNAGDLEILCDAVNSYVQDFLDPSSMQLPLSLRTSATATDLTPEAHPSQNFTTNPGLFVNTSNPVATRSSEEELKEFDNAASFPAAKSDPKLRSFQPRTAATEIYLQPKGLLSHQLFLGQLATEESGSVVNLSVLQLFDLATALDEYAAELVALPKLNNPLSWKKATPAWTSAAAVALLAVGVTAGGVKFFNQPNKQQTANSKAGQQPTPIGQAPIAQVPPPLSPVPISPLPTPVVPPSLASAPKLPPPSAVTLPAPQTAPLPPPIQGPTSSVNPSPATITLLPQRPASPLSGGIGSRTAPSPLSGGIGSRTAPFPLSGGIGSRTAPSPLSGGIGSLPAPSVPTNPSKRASGSSTENSPTRTNSPTALTAPPPLNLPKLKPAPIPENLTAQAVPSPGVRSGNPSADVSQAESAPATNAATNNSLLGEKAQVAAVKNYLQQGWKPPSDLTESLGYTLWLNADGSLQRVEPQTSTAAKYIDRTGIPLVGQPFVSPIEGGRNPIIRVRFSPDGKVETPDYPQ
jgi:hypothetical protein